MTFKPGSIFIPYLDRFFRASFPKTVNHVLKDLELPVTLFDAARVLGKFILPIERFQTIYDLLFSYGRCIISQNFENFHLLLLVGSAELFIYLPAVQTILS